MKNFDEGVESAGRRAFLKNAGLSAAGLLSVSLTAGANTPSAKAQAERPASREQDERAAGEANAAPLREAEYYRPLFERGKGLAG